MKANWKAVVGLMPIICMSVCNANPVLWYHFDEQQPGTVTTNGKSFVTNAVDETKLVGTCHAFWENLVMFTSSYTPVYADSFANGVAWYDPVSKKRGADASAMRFRCSNETSAAGYRSVVVIHDATALQLKTFTVETFFKDVTGGVTTSERALAAFESYVNPENEKPLGDQSHKNGKYAWRLQVDGSGSLFAYFQGVKKADGSTPAQTVGTSNVKVLKDGNWHHVAMSVDNSAKMVRLYIDYKEVSSASLSSEIPYESPYLFIGSDMGTIRSANAVMDEFRISDTVLQPEEMLRPVAAKTDDDTLLYLSFDNWFGGKSWADVTGFPASYLNEAPGASILRVTKQKLGSEEAVYETEAKPMDAVRDGLADPDAVADVSSIELKYDLSKNLGTIFKYDDIARRIMSKSFTAELFFRADTLPPYQYGTYLLSETAGQADSWYVNIGHSDGKVAAGVRATTGGTKSIVSSKSYVDGKWHHVAFVWDKTAQTVRFYIDYSLIGTLSGIDQINNADANTEWKPPYDRYLYIAGRCDGQANQSMHHSGGLDEVRITQRALDPQEFLTGTASASPLLAKVDFENNVSVEPYSDMLPAGALSGEYSYDVKVPGSNIVEKGGTVVEAENTRSLLLCGGSVSFGRNILIEKAADYVVEFYMKGDSVTPGAKILGFDGAWTLSQGENGGTFEITADTDLNVGQTVSFPVDLGRTWSVYAVAFSRTTEGTSISLYRNGQSIGCRTISGYLRPATGISLGSEGFTGRFDEMRVKEGLVEPEKLLFCPPPRGLILVVR